MVSRMAIGGLLVAMAVAGCSSSHPTSPNAAPLLRLVATHALSISEPSDLAIDETGTRLWTVSNNPDSVYELSLDGSRVKSLLYAGQDLEGIAYDVSDHSLWVAEENLREIVHLDLDGHVLDSHPLGLTGEQNSGLEGICLNAAGRVFLTNEKLPGLFITLDPDKSIARIDTLTFAGDYSGITCDPHTSDFWIVSDQSQGLYLWNASTGVAQSFGLPVGKPEGVAIDPATSMIYVVSDSENKLYVFHYEP